MSDSLLCFLDGVVWVFVVVFFCFFVFFVFLRVVFFKVILKNMLQYMLVIRFEKVYNGISLIDKRNIRDI